MLVILHTARGKKDYWGKRWNFLCYVTKKCSWSYAISRKRSSFCIDLPTSLMKIHCHNLLQGHSPKINSLNIIVTTTIIQLSPQKFPLKNRARPRVKASKISPKESRSNKTKPFLNIKMRKQVRALALGGNRKRWKI